MIDFILKHDGRQSPYEEEKKPKLVIPICSCCKKIHVGKFWKQLELRLIKDSDTALSHGLCPNCYEEQRLEFMRFKARKTLYQASNGVSCS